MLSPSKIPVRWPLWFLCLAFMVLGAAQAHAWEVRDTLVAEKEFLLRNPAYDILVVTVLAVEAADATNGNPPRVELRVEEVLRGEDRGPTVMVTWNAPIFHEDTKESGGTTETWKARPLAGPEAAAKLIVFSIGEDAGVLAWSVYRFSSQNRAVVLEHAAVERSAGIQIPVFLLLIVLPIVIVVLFVRALSAKTSSRAKLRLRQAIFALAVLSPGLYVFYELGISAYSNIRIDLLVVVPAIGIALVVGGLALYRPLFRPKTSSQPGAASSGLLAVFGKSLAWGLGAGLAISAVGSLVPILLGRWENELVLLITFAVGRHGFMVGMFLALVIQIRRVLSMPVWSKIAYGLILLLLLFPFFNSILSISSFFSSMGIDEIFW